MLPPHYIFINRMGIRNNWDKSPPGTSTNTSEKRLLFDGVSGGSAQPYVQRKGDKVIIRTSRAHIAEMEHIWSPWLLYSLKLKPFLTKQTNKQTKTPIIEILGRIYIDQSGFCSIVFKVVLFFHLFHFYCLLVISLYDLEQCPGHSYFSMAWQNTSVKWRHQSFFIKKMLVFTPFT